MGKRSVTRRNRRHLAGLGVAVWLGMQLVVAPGSARAADRVALVVGNQAYAKLPRLVNPDSDAKLVAKRLQDVGFEVQLLEDGSKEAMQAALQRFADASRSAQVALIYYSGHGVQVDGVNWLMPVDARIDSRASLDQEAMPLNDVLGAIQQAKPAVGIVILDACRDNPLPEITAAAGLGVTRSLAPREGLARVEGAQGLLIAYATAPGQVALDGPPGGNSPFAASFALFLDQPGLEIGLLFRKVRERVLELTAGMQVPWTEEALTDTLYLKPLPGVETAAAEPVSALNQALAMDDPAEQQVALARFKAQYPASPLDAVAESRIEGLPRQSNTPGIEAELADWQRVQLLAGTTAYGLGLQTYLALHPEGVRADQAKEQLAKPPGDGLAPPPAIAPELLRELVDRAATPALDQAFAALFPDSGSSAAARARLEPAPEVASAAPTTGKPIVVASAEPELLRVYVGTGPVPLELRQGPVEVVAQPHFGELITLPAVASRGIGVEPVGALGYAPAPAARDVVDEFEVAVGTEGDKRLFRASLEVNPCDKLAGNRYDPQGVVLGVFRNEIKAKPARAACEQAVASFPEVPRFRFELGRALEADGDPAAAAEAYRQAADAGHVTALNSLGFLYEEGRGVQRDPEQALQLYREAAAKGDLYAMNNLGRAYRDGTGVPKDMDLAITWLQKAATGGNTFAANNLGSMLLEQKRIDEALRLFQMSADAGDVYGQNNLGLMYERGLGVKQDSARAIQLYQQAAAGGEPHAPINLGLIYRDGRPGVPVDWVQAARWFADAAKQGNAWGTLDLAGLYATGRNGQGQDQVLAARLLARAAADSGEVGPLARQDLARLPGAAVLRAIQESLAQRGYEVGSPDGRMGPRTRTAIQSFSETYKPAIAADAPLPTVLQALEAGSRA